MRTLGAIAVLIVAAPALASLADPDEPMAIPATADGQGEALPFDRFNQRMITLVNIADPRLLDGKMNRDRLKVLARVNAVKNPKALPPEQAAFLAVDYMRLGNGDGLYLNKAIDLLAPHLRDRRPSYFVCTTLAAIHVARGGEFAEAIDKQEAALLDCEMPAEVKGWSTAERNWIAQLDREYVPYYLRIRRSEADPATRPSLETIGPTPLFPLPSKTGPAEPVRFVNEAGKYEPGVLAKAERDKLPPDAIAIVQQLLLWFPTDARLLWLLAELYAADGKFKEADTITYQCTASRNYAPRQLLEHRGAIVKALAAQEKRAAEQAKAALPAEPEEEPISLRAIWLYFAGVIAIATVALVRGWTKRGKANGGMNCCR